MNRAAELIRAGRPLVHCITNFVSMDWMARGLLAVGARPVMVPSRDEVAGMAAAASALLLNQGTWSAGQHESMLLAAAAAHQAGRPVVLDPVGAGGLPVRTKAALELLASGYVTAVRGNAGEILALAGESGQTRGVDSAAVGAEGRLRRAAMELARRYGVLVVATGAVDLVTNGQEALVIWGGDERLTEIPGAGCQGGSLLAALLGAWVAGGGVAGTGTGSAAGGEAQAGSPVQAVVSSSGLLALIAELQLWLKLGAEQVGPGGIGTFTDRYLDALQLGADLPAGRIRAPLADLLRVNVLLDGSATEALVDDLLATGVRSIQFREKKLDLGEQLPIARMMRERCRAAGALFLVNDRLDLALAVEADGVHLGQTDLPVAIARRLLPAGAVIGLSAATPDEARAGLADGADYLGTGAVYATSTKADAGAPIGLEGLAAVVQAVDLPVVGIGGIGPGRVAPVMKTGAVGVAVISAVTGAADPAAAARALLAEALGA
jgi:hydroxyethylthiazole kinase/thiamine-phosphate diphosphorylase